MSESSRRVDVPEGEVRGVVVKRFEVTRDDPGHFMAALHGRRTRPGIYTELRIDGQLWMSDTDAEYRDHWPIIDRFRWEGTKRVLINGLGLGMVVQAALNSPHVEHVDVVERDDRVIELVGPHYLKDDRVEIHHDDAFEIKWPVGTRWDACWHDVWLELCGNNLSEMTTLHRRYGRRTAWQGSWGREFLERKRRAEANRPRFRW